jgi:polyhydroxybutyrate depolymerase
VLSLTSQQRYIAGSMSIAFNCIFLLLSAIISLQFGFGTLGTGAYGSFPDKPGVLTINGYNRTYIVHTPPGVGRRPAVVFMLHGRGGTKEQAAAEFGWRELADKEKFIAVFPQALPIVPDLAVGSPTPATVPFWLGCTNDTYWWSSDFVRNLQVLHHPDDGIFLTRLITKVVAEEHIDPDRVYVTGFSSGGGMVADLAGRYPKSARAFAAIGAIGGLRPLKLSAPVTLFLFAGDADRTVPQPDRWAYIPAGQRLSWFGQATLPTLSSESESWAALDRCVSSTTQSIPWGQRFISEQCANESRLEAYLIHDLGHEWPGSSVSRWNQSHPSLPPLDLTAIIWQFFKVAH